MNTVTLIKKKRSGERLSREELRYLIEGYTKGQIPDYQLSAFLMAVYFKGMRRRNRRSGGVNGAFRRCGGPHPHKKPESG